MGFPSLSDIFFIMVLVLPGYFALQAFRWLAFLKRKLSDTEILYLSLFFSIIIYLVFGVSLGLSYFDDIKDTALEPIKTLYLLVIVVAVGVIPGVIYRKLRFHKSYIAGDSWSAVMEIAARDESGSWLIVYTSDGKEYKGILHYYATQEEKRELSIRKPLWIIRDENLNVIDEVEMGKEIFFKDSDIKRIVFFKEV